MDEKYLKSVNNRENPDYGLIDDRSNFDDDGYLDYYLETQPVLSKEEEEEVMIRINKSCDLIKKMGLTPNIPEPY